MRLHFSWPIWSCPPRPPSLYQVHHFKYSQGQRDHVYEPWESVTVCTGLWQPAKNLKSFTLKIIMIKIKALCWPHMLFLKQGWTGWMWAALLSFFGNSHRNAAKAKAKCLVEHWHLHSKNASFFFLLLTVVYFIKKKKIWLLWTLKTYFKTFFSLSRPQTRTIIIKTVFHTPPLTPFTPNPSRHLAKHQLVKSIQPLRVKYWPRCIWGSEFRG